MERNVDSCLAEGGLDAKVFLLCASALDWWIDFRIELSRKVLEMGNRIMLVPSSARAFFLSIEKLEDLFAELTLGGRFFAGCPCCHQFP